MMRSIGVGLVVLSAALPGPAEAQAGPEVAQAVQRDVSPPLRDIVARLGPTATGVDRAVPIHAFVTPPEADGREVARDPLLELSRPFSLPSIPTPGPHQSFDGANNEDNEAVLGERSNLQPDTTGDVGTDHYVQGINRVIEIFDKATGATVLGPVAATIHWAGFGGPCESEVGGGAWVLYDHLADRWVFSRIASTGSLFDRSYYQCYAVSTSPDPTGAYHRYAFGVFNPLPLDIEPHFISFTSIHGSGIGLWPDGYYFLHNVVRSGADSLTLGVASVVERVKMLAGDEARRMSFHAPAALAPATNAKPSHLEGPPPPAGTPNTYVSRRSFPQLDVNGYYLWDLSVDWNDPDASSFTPVPFVVTADADGVGFVPQPAPGESLRTAGGRYQARVRQFGSHRSMVLSDTVDAGSDRAGVRWAELRDAGSGWYLHQTGTHGPDDGLHRWMGSIAQDRNGNIALGYNATSTWLIPDIRYVSRALADPLGTMPGGEVILHAGTGVQTGFGGRWGEHSTMSTDPFPACTFWYTQEYYATTSDDGFNTRIGSFRVADCGPSLLLQVNDDAGEVVRVSPDDVVVTVDIDDGGSVAPLDWYYALVVDGTIHWAIDGGAGVSETPAPVLSGAPPYDGSDLVLWDLPLASETEMSFVFFLVDGGRVVAADYITAVAS